MNSLDIVLLMITCITDIYYLYLFCGSFLDKRNWIKDEKWHEVLILLCVIVITFAVNVIGNGDINLFLIPIVYMSLGFIMFDSKIGNTFICVLIAYSIMFGCECLFATLMKFTNIQYKSLSDYSIQVLEIKLFEYLVFILIIQILGKKNRKMNKWLFIRYLCIPLSSIGMMIAVFYARSDVYNNQIGIVVFVCFACMVLGNILVFSAFNKYAENMQIMMRQEIELERQKNDLKHYKQMFQSNERHYEIIHDMKHYFNGIYNLAKENKLDSILEVLDDLNMQLITNELIEYCDESYVLNLILSEYSELAEKKGITYDVYVEPGIILNMVKDMDLIVMLKNLLDNALVASVKCGSKAFIRVRVYMQEVGGFCIVKIVNNFTGEIHKNREDFVSTKLEDGVHGFGIKSVNRIAEKYGGYLECSYDLIDKQFETMLILSTVSKYE